MLTGVLASSYLMVERQPQNTRESRTRSSLTYRAEPSLSAPGIDQLMLFESQFKAIEENGSSMSVRQLNESTKKKQKKSENPLHTQD